MLDSILTASEAVSVSAVGMAVISAALPARSSTAWAATAVSAVVLAKTRPATPLARSSGARAAIIVSPAAQALPAAHLSIVWVAIIPLGAIMVTLPARSSIA